MVVHEGIIWAPHSLLVLCLSHCSPALHKASEKPATDPGPQGEAWTHHSFTHMHPCMQTHRHAHTRIHGYICLCVHACTHTCLLLDTQVHSPYSPG